MSYSGNKSVSLSGATLEGRKFYFARDDGKIYAENEIETEIANREGWLLPPRKGEQVTEHYLAVYGPGRVVITRESTGELQDNYPVYVIVNVKEEREGAFDSQNNTLALSLHRTVSDFAILLRSVYVSSQETGRKLLRAVTSYMVTGACDSNAEEDSVCGGTCETCREENIR